MRRNREAPGVTDSTGATCGASISGAVIPPDHFNTGRLSLPVAGIVEFYESGDGAAQIGESAIRLPYARGSPQREHGLAAESEVYAGRAEGLLDRGQLRVVEHRVLGAFLNNGGGVHGIDADGDECFEARGVDIDRAPAAENGNAVAQTGARVVNRCSVKELRRTPVHQQ